MEQLQGGYTLDLPKGTFPLGTDSMVLADFVRLPRSAQVLDLGAGGGTLGTLLCGRDPGCHVTGIEIDPLSHSAAVENIRRNHLEARMNSICADLTQLPEFLDPGGFSVCISNPPYFPGGPAAALTRARREDSCTAEQLMSAAAWALKYGGDFFLVHRPERLAELIALGSKKNLEAKDLRLVRHRQDGPVSLILLHFRKGGKPGLNLDELALFDSQGLPTEAHRRIYHHKEA